MPTNRRVNDVWTAPLQRAAQFINNCVLFFTFLQHIIHYTYMNLIQTLDGNYYRICYQRTLKRHMCNNIVQHSPELQASYAYRSTA